MKIKMREWLINEIDHFIDKVNSILSKFISPSKYQCPICGMISSDASEINADIYNHIYNNDNNKDNNKDNK